MPRQRPNKKPGVKRIGFYCLVEPETKDKLKLIAKAESLSIGELIDKLIADYKGQNDDT